MSLFALLLAPPLQLPKPSGPYAIGTTVMQMTDSLRRDPVEPTLPRTIMVQLWYPTSKKSGKRASYFPDNRLLTLLSSAGYYGQSSDQIEAWKAIETHAVLDAPVLHRHQLKVLLFEPGLGLSRSNYTIYCEELASHGYLLAAIDPCRGGETVLPDGKHLSANDDPENGDPNKLEKKVREWSEDARYVLSNLTRLNRSDASRFVNALDLSKVGMFGHSLGGAAAFDGPFVDSRVCAVIDLDGLPAGDAIRKGLPVPSLALRSNPNYSDADLAKLGRTRQKWKEMGKAGYAVWQDFALRSKGNLWSFAIRDTGHLSYSDAPYVMPSTITRFSSHPLAARRTLELSLDIIRRYFDCRLSASPLTYRPDRSKLDDVVELTHVH